MWSPWLWLRITSSTSARSRPSSRAFSKTVRGLAPVSKSRRRPSASTSAAKPHSPIPSSREHGREHDDAKRPDDTTLAKGSAGGSGQSGGQERHGQSLEMGQRMSPPASASSLSPCGPRRKRQETKRGPSAARIGPQPKLCWLLSPSVTSPGPLATPTKPKSPSSAARRASVRRTGRLVVLPSCSSPRAHRDPPSCDNSGWRRGARKAG